MNRIEHRGLSNQNQRGEGEARLQPDSGREGVVHPLGNPSGLRAQSSCSARSCHEDTSADPRLRDSFATLLAEHQAEAEYQGWLAEVEADWQANQQEEAAAYQVAQLSACAAIYAPTGEAIPGVQLGMRRSTMGNFLDRIGAAIRAEDERQANHEEGGVA